MTRATISRAKRTSRTIRDFSMAILAVNAGSSSLKFAVYPVRHSELLDCVLSGNVQGLEPGGRP